MKNFLKYMGPYKWWVVLTIVFIVAQSLSDLFLPDLNATIIDQGVMKGDIPVIITRGGIMLVVALHRPGKRPDDSVQKYRKYYQDKQATFNIDGNGVEIHLEGQKNYARSNFKEIYGLFDTDMCFYFVIKGKAYYILPRDSVEGGSADDLRKYMEKKCGKRFVHYDTNNG